MKILIVGMGSAGQRHARNLRLLKGNSVELFCYRVRGRNQVLDKNLKVKENENIKDVYQISEVSTLEEGLNKNPDAVFVTNPNHLHMPVALKAAESGCHLFIEKPISHTLEGIQKLKELVNQKNLVCFIGYQMRFHPGFQKLQALLKENAVGNILSADVHFGEYLPHWHPYEDFREYHAARKEEGGGVLLSQIHDLDCIYGLFGLPHRLVAMGGKLSSLPVNVEDTVDILMEFSDKATSFPLHIHQDLLQSPQKRSILVVGDEGTLLWEYVGNTFSWTKKGRETQVFQFSNWERNDMFIDELKHFLECLEGKKAPVVGIEEAEQSLKMALAAHESLRTKGQVFLS